MYRIPAEPDYDSNNEQVPRRKCCQEHSVNNQRMTSLTLLRKYFLELPVYDERTSSFQSLWQFYNPLTFGAVHQSWFLKRRW